MNIPRLIDEKNYAAVVAVLTMMLPVLGRRQPDADETIHFDGADEFFN